jgi:hypothetical protein
MLQSDKNPHKQALSKISVGQSSTQGSRALEIFFGKPSDANKDNLP